MVKLTLINLFALFEDVSIGILVSFNVGLHGSVDVETAEVVLGQLLSIVLEHFLEFWQLAKVDELHLGEVV
jgi:hypothetical protein